MKYQIERSYLFINEKIDKPFLPRSLGERAIRITLQNLYVGIVGSSENAMALYQNKPGALNANAAKGNRMVRSCFLKALAWLSDIRRFAISEEIFNDQILNPARAAAHYLICIRNLSPTTTDMKGIIFCKSAAYYSKSYQDNIITLSIIIPAIEGIMSLRCRPDRFADSELGLYEINNVQPIP